MSERILVPAPQVYTPPTDYLLPSGWLAATTNRADASDAVSAGPTTGVLNAVGIVLKAGKPISNIIFVIGAVAATTSHAWFAIADSSRNMLAVTADFQDGGAAGTVANTPRVVPIATIASGASATFTPTYTGLHYLISDFVAGTMPTYHQNAGGSTASLGLAPVLAGTSETISGGPPSFAKQFGAITAVAKVPLAGVS